MDLFSMTAVTTAMGTVTSGALSGAGGEMGRRSSEALLDLVRRMRRGKKEQKEQGEQKGQGGGSFPLPAEGDAAGPALPITDEEQRALVGELWEYSRRTPGFAREVMEWAREAQWLTPRALVTSAATAAGVVAFGASSPQMLPAVTAAFTDRESVRAQITRLLDGEDEDRTEGAPRVVALTGPGGIGKSATAVHCAHLLKERFPDGQLYVHLAGASASTAVPPSEAFVRFLDRLGVPPDKMPADEQQLAALYRDCMADRRRIVVLDDASTASQVEPLLPAASGSLVIVTSRRRLDRLVAHAGVRHIDIGPLSVTDSVKLLARIAGPERMTDGGASALAATVAEKCGGIPLALCETAARLAVQRHLTLASVDRQLSEQTTSREREASSVDAMNAMNAMDAMNDRRPEEVVRAATDVSYGEVSRQSAHLYRLLGVWPWPAITVQSAAKAIGVGEDEARTYLAELADLHLLEEVGEERYRFHDLLREHARQRAEMEEGHAEMAAAVRRTVTGYLAFAAAADFRVIPSRWRLGPAYRRLSLPEHRAPEDGRNALAELRRERENLAAAVRAAEHYGFDDLVWQLCEAMWGLHLRLGYHQQWIDTHQRGVEAARRCAQEFGDPRAVGRMLTQLAFAFMGLGRTDEAEDALVRAAAADEKAGHHRGQATAVEVLGLLRLKQWRFVEAEECFTQAQRILGRITPGDDGENDVPRALAILEHHVGRALRGQELYADAVRQLHGALDRFRALELPDRYNEGRVYMSLGETHLDAGELQLARGCLDKAISTMAKEGAEIQHADAAELRARCARRLGDSAAEAEDLRAAAALYEAAEDHASETRVRARLAELDDEGAPCEEDHLQGNHRADPGPPRHR